MAAGQLPVAGRQAQRERTGRLRLQLHRPPGLGRAWADGCGGRARGRQLGTQPGAQGLVPLPAGLAARGAPLRLGLVKHLRDRRAGKDVVKLLKQQRPPIGRLRWLARGLGRPEPGQGLGQLRLPQQPLQAAVVAFLVGAAGGTAAVQLQIELIAPHGQRWRQGFEAIEVGAQAAVALRAGQGLVLPQLQLLQHLGGGTAAVIAHPRQPEGLIHAAGGLPLPPVGLHGERITIGADRRGGEGQQLGAAAVPPAKQPMRKRVGGIPGQLVGAKPTHARGRRHRRQARSKAEAVGQPTEVVPPLGETAAAVGLPQLKLPQQRSGAQQHAIALHPGAIDGLEAALLHGPAQACKQLRPVLLDPGVEGGAGVGEVQLRVALHQRQGRFEGAHRRLPGVRHRPQPSQIQMGMAQHMEAAGGPVLGLAPQPGPQRRAAGGIGGVEALQLSRQGLPPSRLQAALRQSQLRADQHA